MQATPRERRSKRWPNGAWISWEVRSAKENSAGRILGLHFQRARLSTTGNRIVLFARKASGWAMKDATGKRKASRIIATKRSGGGAEAEGGRGRVGRGVRSEVA